MKRFFLILFVLGFTKLNAQIHEIGGFLGASNYIGDVGSTKYLDPNQPAFGILYKWNKSPRHSWRISLIHSTLIGDDSKSDVTGRSNRGFSFKNNITEISAGLEFNFFDFNLHQLDRKITPYIYTGVSYFSYKELFYVSKKAKEDYRDSEFAIPMIVGIKTNITPKLIFAGEIGVRYTLTDNLDGSNPKNKNLEPLKFGNINSNDWYVFSGLTLTYTFGNEPCYCKQ